MPITDKTCANCGYVTRCELYSKEGERKLAAERHGEPLKEPLCTICTHTGLSKAMTYPRQTIDPTLYQALAWGLNWIADGSPIPPPEEFDG